MANILAQSDIGERFGTGLGTGLSQALQLLAQTKINNLARQKGALGLQALGFAPDQASGLANLDPVIQREVVKQYLQQPSQEAYAQGLAELLGYAPASQATATNTFQGMPPMTVDPLQALLNPGQAMGQQYQSPMQNQFMQQEQSTAPVRPKSRLSEKQATTLAKLQLQKQQIGSKEQQALNKQSKPFIDKVSALKEAADSAELRLNKMEKLIKKGGLPISAFYNLFKNLEEKVSPTSAVAAGGALGAYTGGPVGAAIGAGIGGLINPVATLLRSGQKLTSPNTEQFEKLTADFIRDAKNIFGSRITDADLAAFMQMIPTLGQTDAGKLAIIKNMKAFNKASEIKYKAMKNVIRANDGRIPANIEILVEETAKPELDKLAQEFTV